MDAKQKNVYQQLEDGDLIEEPCYGFYDWFCSDKALPNKSRQLVKRLESVLKANGLGHRFDPSLVYVFFKNNCPVRGRPYDDLRICRVDNGDVLFTITPSDSHEDGAASLWGVKSYDAPHDSFQQILVGSWKDVIRFFETPAR